uniref:Uncharacterized protein n=1 Tax=Anguilla anguilla TaxID=7936 RepID=A0A0E9Q9L1_ANGAN
MFGCISIFYSLHFSYSQKEQVVLQYVKPAIPRSVEIRCTVFK